MGTLSKYTAQTTICRNAWTIQPSKTEEEMALHDPDIQECHQ